MNGGKMDGRGRGKGRGRDDRREGEEIQLTIKPRLETNNGYLKPCAASRERIRRLASQ